MSQLILPNWLLWQGAVLIGSYLLLSFFEAKWKFNIVLRKPFFMGLVTIAFTWVSGIVFANYLWLVQQHLFNGFLVKFLANGSPLLFIVSFLLLDIIMYAWHRLNHNNTYLWQHHAKHHAITSLSINAAFDFHPKELLISTFWKIILLPIIGIPASIYLTYNTVFFFIILLHHSTIQLPKNWEKILAYIITTPRLHHLHHSKKISESNANFGSCFSIWDTIFATKAKDLQQPINYGLH